MVGRGGGGALTFGSGMCGEEKKEKADKNTTLVFNCHKTSGAPGDKQQKLITRTKNTQNVLVRAGSTRLFVS